MRENERHPQKFSLFWAQSPLRKQIDLYCVDAWKYVPTTEQPVSCQADFDAVFEEFKENIKPFSDFLTVIPSLSENAVECFEDEELSFIFIDASHHYEDVKKDIQLWLPKLKKNGIIAGHDYFTHVHPGVKQAVDECILYVETVRDQNVWWYWKI